MLAARRALASRVVSSLSPAVPTVSRRFFSGHVAEKVETHWAWVYEFPAPYQKYTEHEEPVGGMDATARNLLVAAAVFGAYGIFFNSAFHDNHAGAFGKYPNEDEEAADDEE